MASWSVLVPLLLAGAACRPEPSTLDETSPPLQAPPSRGAAGDADFRVMVAELVSAHSCKLLRGRFQPLRGGEQPDVVTGVLWLRQCTSSSDGTQVTFRLSGNGWQWVRETKRAAGGSFTIDQYVRFRMTARVSGEVDVGCSRIFSRCASFFPPATRRPPQGAPSPWPELALQLHDCRFHVDHPAQQRHDRRRWRASHDAGPRLWL